MGPPLLESHRGATSVTIMSSILNKTYPGVPRVQFPVCDVRDVAKAHVKVCVCVCVCVNFKVCVFVFMGSNSSQIH